MKKSLYICAKIIRDALRDKRLRFGIEKPLQSISSGEAVLCIFLYRCANTFEPAHWTRISKTNVIMRIIFTSDAKSGRVRIELSEEQPTALAPAEERKQSASKPEKVHVRAHWRRRPAKP